MKQKKERSQFEKKWIKIHLVLQCMILIATAIATGIYAYAGSDARKFAYCCGIAFVGCVIAALSRCYCGTKVPELNDAGTCLGEN